MTTAMTALPVARGSSSSAFGMFRRTHTVLSVCGLLMFVCLAHSLKDNSTLANLKRWIQLLDSRANSIKESYKMQRHIVAETIAETERIAASLAPGGVSELEVNRENLRRVTRLGARIRRESRDMEAVWESIQREIERANHIVRMLEAAKKEL